MSTQSQTISVTCPACKGPFVTEVYHVIDVGENPELKWLLLSGKLNTATCPHCDMAGILGMPFAYHDPDKELLFVFTPNETGLPADDQQKLIGSLTQEVMNSLLPEKRKGYLFEPKTFILLDSLFNAILEADGITKEMIEAQQERSRLINELLQVEDDEEKLKELVEARKNDIDYEFFQTLTATAGSAAENGDEKFANSLLALRSRLLKLQSPAGASLTQPQMSEAETSITREELLEHLLETEDEGEFETLVAITRSAIDYTFYLNIANKIETAEKDGRTDEVKQLNDLRDRLLDLTAKMDDEAQGALKAASDLLAEFLNSDDPAQAIDEKIEKIDNLFFYVLTANIEGAAKEDAEKNAGTIAKLQEIASLAGDALEKRMPPRLRLINRLLRTETDEERDHLLSEETSLVDQEMLEMVDALITQFTASGQTSVTKRLAVLREEVDSHTSATSDVVPNEAGEIGESGQ